MSKLARLLYVGTITLADDEGRLKANPAYLRSQIFPYDEEIKISDIKEYLKEIVKTKLIVAYEVDGYNYLKHPKWDDYQKIRGDMFKASTLPDNSPVTKPYKTRNETVTEQVQKRNIRQVKLSKDKIREYKKDILTFWNSQKIIVHRTLSKDTSKEIEKLFGYPANVAENPEDVAKSIIEAIGVYAVVLNGAEYWWSHKWNLYEFLKRGYKQFEGKKPTDYIKGRRSNETEKI